MKTAESSKPPYGATSPRGTETSTKRLQYLTENAPVAKRISQGREVLVLSDGGVEKDAHMS